MGKMIQSNNKSTLGVLVVLFAFLPLSGFTESLLKSSGNPGNLAPRCNFRAEITKCALFQDMMIGGVGGGIVSNGGDGVGGLTNGKAVVAEEKPAARENESGSPSRKAPPPPKPTLAAAKEPVSG